MREPEHRSRISVVHKSRREAELGVEQGSGRVYSVVICNYGCCIAVLLHVELLTLIFLRLQVIISSLNDL